MRVPLDWLGEFVRLPKNKKELTDKLTSAGHMLDKIEVTDKNTIIDLELRGNRADCYSIIGIAREVSSLFNTPIKNDEPKIKIKKQKKLSNLNFEVKSDLAQRVMMTVVRDVKIEKSPSWLSKRLKEYGMESINNIVDLTNYVMIETGQPMHAFDLAKIGQEIEIRLARENEEIITFQDKKVILTKDDLVWADEKNVLSLAGAIGAKAYSVSDGTKDILVEAANYERTNIRRSIYRLKLLTQAGIRHEKELDKNFVETGIKRFLQLIKENKWGKIENTPIVLDYYPKPQRSRRISLDLNYANSLSGTKINKKEVIKILQSLNFKIEKQKQETIVVKVPTYRTDVNLPEDLIEEIQRINGYDKIPTQTLSHEIPKDVTPDYIKQELKIKNMMISLGFNEVISQSFVKEDYLNLNESLDDPQARPIKVINRPSPDTEYLRISHLPNLLEIARKIINERGEKAMLFEIGKVYFKKDTYRERRKLGIMYYENKDQKFPYFKGFIETIFSHLGTNSTKWTGSTSEFKITRDKEVIATGKIIEKIFYVEIDLDKLPHKNDTYQVKLWPKFPPQIEDITFNLLPNTNVDDLINLIKSEDKVEEVDLVDTYKENYTFRVRYQDPDKTLTDDEVRKIRESYLRKIKQKLGISPKN